MVKTRMITKICPKCEVSIAVASKRCTRCNYNFNKSPTFSQPQPIKSSSKKKKPAKAEKVDQRRSNRVRREKPNYYDSVQFDQKKKKKPKSKSSKTSSEKPVLITTTKETTAARAKRRREKKEKIEDGVDLAGKLTLEKQDIAKLILAEINRKLGSVVWNPT
uniref:Uncharacterized protein n=1 Tax=Corethrella appendiculata TaxID=1370023 RepID=U5EWL5_9DIPT